MNEPTIATPIGALSALATNPNIVGAAWMASSALLTTYSTTKFLKFDEQSALDSKVATVKSSLSRPSLLTVCRFGGSLLFGLLAHPNLQVAERIRETWAVIPNFAVPAIFLFIANFANSISLNRIGISLTYTTKCGIPLITVFLTLLLDGAKAMPKPLVLASLLPIALGIAAASWDSPTFESIGFLAALISCTAQSALNVSSKRAIAKTALSGPQAQRAMVAVGFCIAAGFALLQQSSNSSDTRKRECPVWLAGMAVTAYHIEYLLSFCFVKLVSPISYGACDAIRRLAIIISGHYMFGGVPFSRLNIGGIMLALIGALCYSFATSS